MCLFTKFMMVQPKFLNLYIIMIGSGIFIRIFIHLAYNLELTSAQLVLQKRPNIFCLILIKRFFRFETILRESYISMSNTSFF